MAERTGPPVVALALTVVAAVLVVAVALLAGRFGPEPPTLEEVVRFDPETIAPGHTEDEVDYPQDPPVGGIHDPVWLDCGVYDVQVRAENLVHDLEHGTVFIAYRPGLAEQEVERLAALLPDNGILSPWEGLSAPVVVTVWGAQLALDGPADRRLPLFIEQFGNGETAPEPEASCRGGVPDPGGEESTGAAA